MKWASWVERVGGEEGQNKVVGEEEVEDVVRLQVIISK